MSQAGIAAQTLPISGRVDRATATEVVDLGSILGRVKPKTKSWYSQLTCLKFSN